MAQSGILRRRLSSPFAWIAVMGGVTVVAAMTPARAQTPTPGQVYRTAEHDFRLEVVADLLTIDADVRGKDGDATPLYRLVPAPRGTTAATRH